MGNPFSSPSCADERRRAAPSSQTGYTPFEGATLPYGSVVGLVRDLARKLDPHTAEVLAPLQELLLGSPDEQTRRWPARPDSALRRRAAHGRRSRGRVPVGARARGSALGGYRDRRAPRLPGAQCRRPGGTDRRDMAFGRSHAAARSAAGIGRAAPPRLSDDDRPRGTEPRRRRRADRTRRR